MQTLKKFDRLLSGRLPFIPSSSVRSYRLTSSNQNLWGVTIQRMKVDIPTLVAGRELQWCTFLCERYTVDDRLISPHVQLVGGSDLRAVRPVRVDRSNAQLEIWPHFDGPCPLFAGRSIAPVLGTRNANVTLRFARGPGTMTSRNFDWVVWIDGHEAYIPKTFQCKRVETDEETWTRFTERLKSFDDDDGRH